MAARNELMVQITSAEGLKNVNRSHGELKPYAVVHVEPGTKISTYATGATLGGWDQKLFIPFSTPIEESTLHFEIFQDQPAEDINPFIGSAQITLGDLFTEGVSATRSLELQRPKGPDGLLEIAVRLRNLAVDVNDDRMDVD